MTMLDWKAMSFDVTGAFTTVEETQYMFIKVPWGILGTQPNEVWQIVMGLYGSRHASRQYYDSFVEWLMKMGFQRLFKDTCTFMKRCEFGYLVLAMYVDDIILFSHLADAE